MRVVHALETRAGLGMGHTGFGVDPSGSLHEGTPLTAEELTGTVVDDPWLAKTTMAKPAKWDADGFAKDLA